MDYNQLIETCRNAIMGLPNDQTFTVSDLFVGADWKAFPKGVRLELGRRFKLCVARREIDNVIYVGKADNNSALYRKQIAE